MWNDNLSPVGSLTGFVSFFMTENRPYILISNDDGYQAGGINFLIDTLKSVADLLVVAPDGPRSGFSTAITSAHPIHAVLIRKEPGLTVYACSGTPTDCVKLALNRYIERRPDLVIGGINHGDNSSVNAHYSGTMGVVQEAAMQGLPAVAFSLCDMSAKADFTPLRPYLIDITMKALMAGLPEFTCLNVNFPKCPKFEGIRICRMARSRWEKDIKDLDNAGRSGNWYWLVGDCQELEPNATDTDRWALSHGYVAITPTTLDNTATRLMPMLKSLF